MKFKINYNNKQDDGEDDFEDIFETDGVDWRYSIWKNGEYIFEDCFDDISVYG